MPRKESVDRKPAQAVRITNVAGLLSVEEAANELGTTDINIMRLVARGRLAASKLSPNIATADKPDRLKMRILASELARYVADGAEDFTPPIFAGNWLAGPEDWMAKRIQAELGEACDGQLASEEAVVAAHTGMVAAGENSEQAIRMLGAEERTLRKTPEFVAVCNAKLESGDAWLAEKYRSKLHLYAVERLRHFASFYMGRTAPPGADTFGVDDATVMRFPSLERLYSEEYDAICKGAMELLRAAPAVTLKSSSRVKEGKDRGKYITIYYKLPFSAIQLLNNSKLLCDLAF